MLIYFSMAVILVLVMPVLTLLPPLPLATGADIAASNDTTGHKDLGGDWDLEVISGQVEAEIAVSQEAQSAFVDTLLINDTDQDGVDDADDLDDDNDGILDAVEGVVEVTDWWTTDGDVTASGNTVVYDGSPSGDMGPLRHPLELFVVLWRI